ncbi:MAG: FKBP-type peptidyl-prolyl cis-trans isomerase [Campylobacterota bacterium]|nr:FKBP-type peptidyl-prolyl cis-trans isomerase [Campylobacterota bacterium]
MLKHLSTVIGCLGLITACAIADSTLTSQNQKASYVLGAEIGKQLVISKEDLDLDAMMLGMKDVFAGSKPKLSQEEMRSAMQAFQENKQKKQLALMQQYSDQNKKKGTAFLNANKKKKGVTTLPSGLQYRVIKSGKGGLSPKTTDTVVTHYHGTLIDGTVFDSSYDRGEAVSFPVNAVIKGWTEALTKMKVGDKWQLVIPSDLAYGERGVPPKIGPDSVLLFDVELLEIKKG